MSSPPLLGLRSLIYAVNNIEAAKRWYTAVLGQAPYFDSPAYVGFNVGGFELGLWATEQPVEVGGAHGYWGVEDIDAEYSRLLELGAREHTPVQNVGGEIRLGTVLDPFGNILGVIYNPGFNVE